MAPDSKQDIMPARDRGNRRPSLSRLALNLPDADAIIPTGQSRCILTEIATVGELELCRRSVIAVDRRPGFPFIRRRRGQVTESKRALMA